MSSSQEVHRLIVRLVGDGKSLEAVVDKAVSGINEVVKAEKAAQKAIESFQRQQAREAIRLKNEERKAIAAFEREQASARVKQTRDAEGAMRKKQAAAQREVNREIREGARITQLMLTPLEQYERRLRHLDGLLQRARISQTTFNRAVLDAKAAFDKAQPPTVNWGKTLLRVGGDMRNFGMSWSMYVTAPITAFGFAAGKAGLDIDTLRRGLDSVSGSAEETNNQLRSLRIIARMPGLSFKEAIEGSVSLQAAGFSAYRAERALKAFGNALATVGKGRTELHMVNRALVQIAGKGKIMAQEVNQIAEHLPQIRRLMTEAFGTANSEEISKMGIKSEEFINKIVERAEKLPRVTKGAKIDIENLMDSTFIALSKIGEAILEFIGPSIRSLTKWLDRAGEAFANIDPQIKKMILGAAALTAAVGPLILITGSMVVAAGQLVTGLTNLSMALKYLVGQQVAAAGTAAVLQAGFVGLAVAGVGFLIYKLTGAADAFNELNIQEEKNLDLTDQLMSVWERDAQAAIASIEGLSKAQQKLFLEKRIKENVKAISDYHQAIASIKSQMLTAKAGGAGFGIESFIGSSELRELQKELDDVQKMLDTAGKKSKLFNEELARVESITEDAIDPEILEKGQELIDSLKLEIATFAMTSREAKIYEQELKKLPPAMIATLRSQDSMLTKLEEQKKQQEESTEAFEKYRDELNKNLATLGMTEEQVKLWELAEKKVSPVLREQIKALQERNQKLQLGQDIKDLVKDLDKQAKQAGMTAEQVKRLELAEKGATAAMLQGVDAAIQRKTAAEAQAEADKLVVTLREQLQTIGMSADAINAWKLGQQGASRETVELAKRLAEQKELMEEGAKLMEEHQTPIQKYTESYRKLRQMLSIGAIKDIRVFKEELKEIQQELVKAQLESDLTIKMRVTGLESLTLGQEKVQELFENTRAVNAAKAINFANIHRQAAPNQAGGAQPVPAPNRAVPQAGRANPALAQAAQGQQNERQILLRIAQGVEALAARDALFVQPMNLGNG